MSEAGWSGKWDASCGLPAVKHGLVVFRSLTWVDRVSSPSACPLSPSPPLASHEATRLRASLLYRSTAPPLLVDAPFILDHLLPQTTRLPLAAG